ncbi:zinc-ribbon domain-containing protein [Neisseriaceae bacterium B1]
MSKIKVNCPQCKQAVAVEKSELNATQGRVDCPHCAHVFHLVKKSKKAAESAPKVDKAQPAYREPHADDLKDIEAMFRKAETLDTHASKSQTPLAYRIPKAPNKKPKFAEVGSEAFAFNLLDRDSINAQMPQVSVKPASNAAMPIPASRTGEQQNNITIHTDSLVFTLMGDGQNPMAGLTQPQMMPSTQLANGMVAAAPTPIAVAVAQNETNWTIATIAALIVLILQLFYLIMMLI